MAEFGSSKNDWILAIPLLAASSLPLFLLSCPSQTQSLADSAAKPTDLPKDDPLSISADLATSTLLGAIPLARTREESVIDYSELLASVKALIDSGKNADAFVKITSPEPMSWTSGTGFSPHLLTNNELPLIELFLNHWTRRDHQLDALDAKLYIPAVSDDAFQAGAYNYLSLLSLGFLRERIPNLRQTDFRKVMELERFSNLPAETRADYELLTILAAGDLNKSIPILQHWVDSAHCPELRAAIYLATASSQEDLESAFNCLKSISASEQRDIAMIVFATRLLAIASNEWATELNAAALKEGAATMLVACLESCSQEGREAFGKDISVAYKLQNIDNPAKNYLIGLLLASACSEESPFLTINTLLGIRNNNNLNQSRDELKTYFSSFDYTKLVNFLESEYRRLESEIDADRHSEERGNRINCLASLDQIVNGRNATRFYLL
jgi:hypothetical protein